MIIGIVQARMGSTRFPGKVLRYIDDKTLLQHMIERIKRSKLIDKFVIATSVEAENSLIEDFCNKVGVSCFRGSENDVLDRYYKCVKSLDPLPDIIVRMTADCPLSDPNVIDFVVRELIDKKVDYVTNSFEPLFEDGFDVEAFTFEALEVAWKNSTLRSEREHVTPYMKKSSAINKIYKKYSHDYIYKLSVDTPNDFKLIQNIFSQLYSPEKIFTMMDVVNLLKSYPEMLDINSESVINEGYKKSLSMDKTD